MKIHVETQPKHGNGSAQIVDTGLGAKTVIEQGLDFTHGHLQDALNGGMEQIQMKAHTSQASCNKIAS
ncbi:MULTISPECIES: hypothetical protein [Vitreoscilla]|uniref:Uncharacterized protein n=1 Tax=Vitreoscilla stercoraria TaxID=61 RepID=A0ABY4E7S4_VITST|nr:MULTISPECIES: hypothetical protein [Vitreoscilla]AUZ04955.1 hypothetical protein ADP71_13350 [Vitreoscilla sp. C1]UOO91401.1 hypothetical protein LVJ81_06905 [Vitreoscilla stercoraria]